MYYIYNCLDVLVEETGYNCEVDEIYLLLRLQNMVTCL